MSSGLWALCPTCGWAYQPETGHQCPTTWESSSTWPLPPNVQAASITLLSGGAITEERVREIVREELARAAAGVARTG